MYLFVTFFFLSILATKPEPQLVIDAELNSQHSQCWWTKADCNISESLAILSKITVFEMCAIHFESHNSRCLRLRLSFPENNASSGTSGNLYSTPVLSIKCGVLGKKKYLLFICSKR